MNDESALMFMVCANDESALVFMVRANDERALMFMVRANDERALLMFMVRANVRKCANVYGRATLFNFNAEDFEDWILNLLDINT